ncbi:hypothetical protein PT974_01741 [Cladobotryum mycophilum]|uniref:Uncharacterized protein n=1 Tax=Cladobotryum mycophilum TaxID=491253 RepID=A0ABR0SWY9_9HYPO
MAAQNDPTVASLDLRLFDDDDDAEDLAYKQIINGLVIQATTPSQVAAQIDEWVIGEANRRYSQLKERDPPFKLTEEEKDSLYLVGPNPSRHVDMIIGCVAVVCSAFPPNHAVQDALLEFIEQLNALPKHDVPDISYDDSDNAVFDKKLSLWSLDTSSTEYLAQKFQREAEELAYPFSEVETAGSEFQLRWRNLQSFISRLTTLGLINCSAVSALSYILPSSHTYPDLKERSVGGSHRIASDLIAASQWLAPDQACQWVYQQCKTSAGEADGSRKIWTMQHWDQWKAQMSLFAADERFSEETRLLARSLREKMESLE